MMLKSPAIVHHERACRESLQCGADVTAHPRSFSPPAKAQGALSLQSGAARSPYSQRKQRRSHPQTRGTCAHIVIAVRSLHEMADRAAEAIRYRQADGVPMVLFGHGLGGLLAYEVACRFKVAVPKQLNLRVSLGSLTNDF